MPLTLLDCAALAEAAYADDKTTLRGFVRRHRVKGQLGFQGAIYARANGRGFDVVVTCAGTQPTSDMGADLISDIGFVAGANTSATAVVASAAGAMLGGPLWMVVAGLGVTIPGMYFLAKSIEQAAEMLVQGKRETRGSGALVLTGHSLGGGIAQILAAGTGVSAAAFNAPAVSRFFDAGANQARTKARIHNLHVKGDPINLTDVFGNWLGTRVWIDPGRSGLAAHDIASVVRDLSPAGPYTDIGSRRPFD